jgi:hypothetical protein
MTKFLTYTPLTGSIAKNDCKGRQPQLMLMPLNSA